MLPQLSNLSLLLVVTEIARISRTARVPDSRLCRRNQGLLSHCL